MRRKGTLSGGTARTALPASLLPPPDDLSQCDTRWRLLWRGTLATLKAEEPRAYQRLLAKLQRHRLASRSVRVERTDESAPVVITECLDLAGDLEAVIPSDAVLDAVRAFARDKERVRLRGRALGQRLSPRWLLVLAYYGALWWVDRQDGESKTVRGRGESREDRALALVAERYGHTLESTRRLVKDTRGRLPPPVKRHIMGLAQQGDGGEYLWKIAMRRGK